MTVVLTAMMLSMPAAPSLAAEGEHCVVLVDNGEETCFGSVAEVDAFVAEPETGSDPAPQAAGRVIIGRFFEDANFGGQSFTFAADHPCKDNKKTDWWAKLGPVGWENRISSLQTYGNCWIQLYSGPNYDGDRDGPFKTDTGFVGPFMNDRAKSVKFD